MPEETSKTPETSDVKKDEKKAKDTKGETPAGGGWVMRILLGFGVAVVAGGAGAATSLLLRPDHTVAEVTAETPDLVKKQNDETLKEFEYYPFEAVTVNLNVRSGDRYLKVKVFLAIAPGDKEEAFAELDKRQKELKDWLMAYLRDHTLEEVSGKKNQVRMQREIAQAFNEKLWPDARPRIDHVLFDEFTVQ